MRRDYQPSREKRQELASAAGRGPSCAGFKYSAGSGASSVGYEEENSNTLTADWHAPAVFMGDAGCLNPEDPQSKRIFTPDSCGPTLSSGTGEGMNIQPSVITFAQNSRDEVRIQGDGTLSGALSAQPGMKQQTYVAEVVATEGPVASY